MPEKELEKLQEEYFNTLFETKVIRHETSTNRQFVDTKIVCSNKALDGLFKKLYSDYKVKERWNDYYSECVYWTWMAVNRFVVKDEGDWEGIIAGTDKPNTGRLITSIKKTVTHEIYRYINEGAKFTRGEVDGVKGQHVVLKFDMKSLDALLTADGEEGTILDLISEEANFFHSVDLAKYQASYFTKWFRENKNRLLEPSQIMFLNQLENCRKVEGYTITDPEKDLGMTSSAVNSRMRRIKNRIAKLWLQENLNGAKNRLQMTLESELELWKPVIAIIENEAYEKQNSILSAWIVTNAEKEKVANMLYDHLTNEQGIELTKLLKGKTAGNLSPVILYTFINAIENRIQVLNNTNTTVTPVTKAPNYKMKMYEMEKKRWDNQPIIVTDLQGNFIREEKSIAVKRKSNIQIVLPTGNRLPI